MSLKDILTICLALILVVGIFSLPYDFDLSIGNNTDSEQNTDDVTGDTDNENAGDTDSDESGDINNDEEPPSLISTPPHSYIVYCSSCSSRVDVYEEGCSKEDYGSIGESWYNIQCDCGEGLYGGFYHEYSNKDGVCTASGCGHECTHTFTFDAINYLLPGDEQFSMFDVSTLSSGDSSVYEGVCTICQKTITD